MTMAPEFPQVSPWMLLPFGSLLGLIALAPFLFPAWWSRHYAKLACGLAATVVGYYCFHLHAPSGVWRTTREYLSFIALIGSLFVVSGGIHIQVKGEATPGANVLFLLLGAVLANLLGTTGASMLLIRPWLRLNKYRLTGHHVIFFIFIVSNVGGCLTPIGDPPLFLGYLMGVPFGWVLARCLPIWLVGVGLLLLMFYWRDRRNFRRAPAPLRAELTAHEQWRVQGLENLPFLGFILAAVFIHRPPFLREALMAAAALGSWLLTRRSVHEANHFSLQPLREVAILFIGIFATMMPALDWLQFNAARLDLASPGFYFWGSGSLSSVLDNSPTYLCFLKAIFGRFVDPGSLGHINQLLQTHAPVLATATGPYDGAVLQTLGALLQYHPTELARGSLSPDQIQVAYLLGNLQLNPYLVAVSVGAVFFGANTYIGNGPNFMVKAIAEHQKVHTPSFLGYIFCYTLPFMVLMLVIVWWLFFR
jgi:Na+/H+ antiporter NhaD/arsenite permease-like protein